MNDQKQVEFDRPGERSLEQDFCCYYTLVIDLIGQLRRDVIGRVSVKPLLNRYWL